MKKLLSILLCAALIFSLAPARTTYAAGTWPSNVTIEADGGILIDADSGTVLYSKNIHETYYPASITKILTAYIIINYCDLDDTVTFTHSAVNTLEPGSSILGARVGDKMSVRDCLYALLLQSANEVANALAEHCSGSVEAFAELMNEEAKKLGCVDSNFANPSGLNNPNHYTSAHDMSLIAKAAFSDPTFLEIDKTLYYDVPAGQLQQYPDGWRYYMHHRMMKKNDSQYYSGIIGGKTGYTSLAGNTLVTCAERDGLKLIAVVLNGRQTHYSDTKALLDFGFENFKSVLIADQDSAYQEIENDLSIGGIFSGDTIKLSVDTNSAITLPMTGNFADVTSSLDYELDETAPKSAVARIDYKYGDRIVGQAYLETSTVPGYVVKESIQEVSSTSVTSETEETALESVPSTEAAKPTLVSDQNKRENSTVSIFDILKKILTVGGIIGAVGVIILGIIIYREKQEERAMTIRRQNRERRRKEWGATTEFNLVMQEHLRSKNQFKKRSLWDKIKNWFRR